jgi:hypothetical protein
VRGLAADAAARATELRARDTGVCVRRRLARCDPRVWPSPAEACSELGDPVRPVLGPPSAEPRRYAGADADQVPHNGRSPAREHRRQPPGVAAAA